VLWIELTSKYPLGEGRHMEFELYRSILAELRAPSVLRLSYSGESANHPQFLEAIRLAAETGATTEVVSAFATFPEQQFEPLVRSGLDRLTVSLHALDAADPGSIDRGPPLDDTVHAIEGLLGVRDRLGSTKPVVDVAMVVTPRTLGRIAEIAAHAHRLGIREVHVEPLMLTAAFGADVRRAAAEVTEQYPGVAVEFSTPAVDPQERLDGAPRAFTARLPGRAHIYSCDQNPWDTMHILANGDVVSCEVRDTVVLGNVRRSTLGEIWRGEAYRRFRRDYARGRPAACRACAYKVAYVPGGAKDAVALADGMNPRLVRGWHAAEGGIVWSRERGIAILEPRKAAGSLRIDGILPPARHDARNVLVVDVNGRPAGSVVNDTTDMLSFGVTLPFEPVTTAPVRIDFRATDVYRPKEDGSEDVRELGFALQRLELVEGVLPRKPPRPPRPARPPRGTRRRELRLRRLAATLALARAMRGVAARVPPRRPRTSEWQPGLSIIVSERASPELLAGCLEPAQRAARAAGEPFELIVVVNGAPLAQYADLRTRYPNVRWLHATEPLSFGTAVRRGLRAARYDGVYLLNNDMVVNDGTFAALLSWRGRNVFAIASQIVAADPAKRRAETGWTDVTLENGRVESVDVEPEPDGAVRGHVYASGGSALYRRQYLQQLHNRADPYTPLCWQDAEWGIRAWREGYEVLFCPQSTAFRRRPSTIARFFAPADLDRIVARNATQFLLRNMLHEIATPAFLQGARDRARCPDLTLRELTSVRNSLALIGAQWQAGRAPSSDAPLRDLRRKYYPTPFPATAGKPCLLLVSPYAIYPPAHGGAIRIAELVRTLSTQYRVVLLSDELPLYTPSSIPYFAGLHAVHLTMGRTAESRERIPRIARHCHSRLRAELRRLIASYRPDVVQIEFVELAALIEERRDRVPWFITHHDVLFSPGEPTDEDRFESALIERYDGAIVCSPEDAALMRMPVDVVPNGTRMAEVPYVPSRGNTTILFAGPFRYAPNFDGIRSFLEIVYPSLKRTIPALQLLVLGGHDAPAIAKDIPCFGQPGVEVAGYTPDVVTHLQRCALTINPLDGMRGSSIKLIESVAAGRVCVSTANGARGFRSVESRALVVVDRVEDFGPPLERLLLDEAYRIALEEPSPQLREATSWAASARRQLEVYRRHGVTAG
jgi:GT2 family glycosyltransferase/MoaA/NifB/PqqE/SkfB family radical SAM enzyme